MPNTNGNSLGAAELRARRARKVRRDWPIHTFKSVNGTRPLSKRRGIPVIAYDTALTESAYGRPAQLGDLFNDVMGAVVPGWTARPEWMKKIVIKPDPNKLIDTALKVVPPKTVEKVFGAAEQAGFQTYYGNQYVSPWGAASLYETGAKLGFKEVGGVPMWVWMAGGGLLVVLLVTMKR